MTRRAARLAIAILAALLLRAAEAQQYPAAPPGNPYGQPIAPSQPPANTALRYPLPNQPGAASAPPPGAVRRSVGDLPPQPGNAVAPTTAIQPAIAPETDFQAGRIFARVGDKSIFAGDVTPIVDQLIDQNLAKAKTPIEREQILAARDSFTRGVLRRLVEMKAKYLAFEREFQQKITDSKKRSDKLKDIDRELRSKFESALEKTREKVAHADAEELQKLSQRDFVLPRLAILMRDNQAESLGELDAVLRRYGTTLDRQVRLFIEDIMGNQVISHGMNMHPDISHEEMLDYYRQHIADYAVPAKAKFEILTIKWGSFPTRDEARNKLAAMGNEVFLGANFAAVAAKHSEEPNAKEGGQYEVSQGSLASQAIDQAVFGIEVGKLSQMLEDDTGCHIIRVKTRQPAGQVSFLEAQEKIKETIRVQKLNTQYKKLLETLQARTDVWTIFDPPPVAPPTGENAANRG